MYAQIYLLSTNVLLRLYCHLVAAWVDVLTTRTCHMSISQFLADKWLTDSRHFGLNRTGSDWLIMISSWDEQTRKNSPQTRLSWTYISWEENRFLENERSPSSSTLNSGLLWVSFFRISDPYWYTTAELTSNVWRLWLFLWYAATWCWLWRKLYARLHNLHT